MIRPCDQCGGSGIDPESYVHRPAHQGPPDAEPCPRCEGMPGLDARKINFSHLGIEVMSRIPAEFRPDPDTVMRWCFTHELCPPCQVGGTYEACDLGWVARPVRLEEAE
jgi:hypothetical protein